MSAKWLSLCAGLSAKLIGDDKQLSHAIAFSNMGIFSEHKSTRSEWFCDHNEM